VGKIFFLVFVLFGVAGLGLHFYLQYQAKNLSRQKERLLLTNALLSEKIARLKSDPAAYEEVARQKYGLIKPNERLIIFEK